MSANTSKPAKPATTEAETLKAVQAEITATYQALTTAGQRAAFTRRLKAANLPLPAVAGVVNPLDTLLAEVKALPVAERQTRIDSEYGRMEKAGVKAAFVRRLKEAGLPEPVRNVAVSVQDALIASLRAKLAGVTKH